MFTFLILLTYWDVSYDASLCSAKFVFKKYLPFHLLILDQRTQSNLSLEGVIISQESILSVIIKNIVGKKAPALSLF